MKKLLLLFILLLFVSCSKENNITDPVDPPVDTFLLVVSNPNYPEYEIYVDGIFAGTVKGWDSHAEIGDFKRSEETRLLAISLVYLGHDCSLTVNTANATELTWVLDKI